MADMTAQRKQLIASIATRTGFSGDAVTHMIMAVLIGNGSMAQFSHPEFGGSGQWMRGGMLMIGDMFNQQLKWRVDGLCNDIAQALADQPELFQTGQPEPFHAGSSQSQSQGDGWTSNRADLESFLAGSHSHSSRWYPAELGHPTSSGSQNSMRYAYFADQRRLAVDAGGVVSVYDTRDHRIGGFSQQQGDASTFTFTSQHGPISVAALPLVLRNGVPATPQSPTASGTVRPPDTSSVYEAIERLADLKSKGILTDEEYASKKAELLGRI